MMGCSSSMDTSSIIEEPISSLERWQNSNMDPVAVIQEFVRLDEQIGKVEAGCPGPRMATAEAWVEHLQSQRDTLLGVDGVLEPALSVQQKNIQIQQQQQQQQQQRRQPTTPHNEILTVNELDSSPTHANVAEAAAPRRLRNGALPRGIENGATNGIGVSVGVARHSNSNNNNNNNIVANTPTQDLANLALNLGVIGDANKASTHEDFFANLSESALYLMAVRYHTEILEHTKVRLKTLIDSYAELNELYVNHDGVIAFISGGTYMTRLEESLDSQLEAARDVRDKLGSALEQWRICGTLLRACATSATQALQLWQQLAKVIIPKEKIQLALECRTAIQASLISVDCAQLALPHVEIKHVSNRQLLAVKHCNTYMITDIANLSRYEHTTKVFAAYESSMAKASMWLHETFNKTLRHDFDKAQETVRNMAKNLRDHREEIFTAARK